MGKPEHIETRLWINGKFVESSDKHTFALHSPYSKEVVAHVSEASEKDTDEAVAAAQAAFPSWSALSPAERGAYFKKLAQLIRQHHQEMAHLEAISMGRPVKTYFDAFVCADTFDYYAEASYPTGKASLNTPGFVNMTLRQPYGVVAAIIPWNVPAIMFGNKVAPALAAGNTVVLKSSEKAPLTSAFLAHLIKKANFPHGVINVLHGHGHKSGSILSHHMSVRCISFTGSCRTGKIIKAAAAKSNLKEVSLELGGKSPAIIFADADLDKAVEETQYSIQFNSGQVCIANSRIYVEEGVAHKFVEKFKERFAKVQKGDPTREDVNHGPQADRHQWDTIRKYIDEGTKTGELVLGGYPEHKDMHAQGHQDSKQHQDEEDSKDGYFVNPTIFLHQPEDSVVMKEEIFGPVVSINTFKTEAEVIQKANDTEFGLYASVYTKDLDRALRLAKAIESGTVAINAASPTIARDMAFGGYKQSGSGRDGLGESLEHFLETKTVLIKVQDAAV